MTDRVMPWGTYPSGHAATETAEFDDSGFEAVVYDERTAEVHVLNTGASAVWAMCDGHTGVEAIVEEIADLFAADRRQVARQVRDSLDEFWARGLLMGSPEPPLSGSATTTDSRILVRPPDP